MRGFFKGMLAASVLAVTTGVAWGEVTDKVAADALRTAETRGLSAVPDGDASAAC